MSEFIKKQCVVRNNGSHFSIEERYANKICGELVKADAFGRRSGLLKRNMVTIVQNFLKAMNDNGYGFARVAEDKDSFDVLVGIETDGSIVVKIFGDMHAPFNEEWVRKACDEAGIELVTVNEN